jgi:hypothetical protein
VSGGAIIAAAAIGAGLLLIIAGVVVAWRVRMRFYRQALDRRHRMLDRLVAGVRAPGNANRFSLRPERTEHNG